MVKTCELDIFHRVGIHNVKVHDVTRVESAWRRCGKGWIGEGLQVKTEITASIGTAADERGGDSVRAVNIQHRTVDTAELDGDNGLLEN